jgi:hypothetical protein
LLHNEVTGAVVGVIVIALFEQQVWDKNGEPDKKSDNDHPNDGAGYFIVKQFPIGQRATFTLYRRSPLPLQNMAFMELMRSFTGGLASTAWNNRCGIKTASRIKRAITITPTTAPVTSL